MATLTYSYFCNASRSYHRAHYSPFLLLTYGGGHKYSILILPDYRARNCLSRQPHASAAGGRPLAAAFFF